MKICIYSTHNFLLICMPIYIILQGNQDSQLPIGEIFTPSSLYVNVREPRFMSVETRGESEIIVSWVCARFILVLSINYNLFEIKTWPSLFSIASIRSFGAQGNLQLYLDPGQFGMVSLKQSKKIGLTASRQGIESRVEIPWGKPHPKNPKIAPNQR